MIMQRARRSLKRRNVKLSRALFAMAATGIVFASTGTLSRGETAAIITAVIFMAVAQWLPTDLRALTKTNINRWFGFFRTPGTPVLRLNDATIEQALPRAEIPLNSIWQLSMEARARLSERASDEAQEGTQPRFFGERGAFDKLAERQRAHRDQLPALTAIWSIGIAAAMTLDDKFFDAVRSDLVTYGFLYDSTRRPRLGATIYGVPSSSTRTGLVGTVVVAGQKFPVARSTWRPSNFSTTLAPQLGEAACWAEVPGVGLGEEEGTGVLTASHVLAEVRAPASRVGESVLLRRRGQGKALVPGTIILDEPCILDLAVVAPAKDYQVAKRMAVRTPEVLAPGQVLYAHREKRSVPVRIESLSGPGQNVIAGVPGRIPVVQNLIMLDKKLKAGYSGALVTTKAGDVAGLFLGTVKGWDGKTLGRALDLRQAVRTYALHLYAEEDGWHVGRE